MSDHSSVLYDVSTLTDHDIYLFKEGNHFRLYEKFGSHMMTVAGQKGSHFAVWAPNAAVVSVTGDFNEWDTASHPLKVRADETGIWEGSSTSIILSHGIKAIRPIKETHLLFFGRLLLRQPLLYRIWITNGRIRIG
jgi:1,4-alpha-glucan branching enzyme